MQLYNCRLTASCSNLSNCRIFFSVEDEEEESNTGVIVGAVVGSLIGVAAIGGAVSYAVKYQKKKQKVSSSIQRIVSHDNGGLTPV